MTPNLLLVFLFLLSFTLISSQTPDALSLCETQCRGPILTCFSSPICKEAFETCYPKCHKFDSKRMKLDFTCFSDCLAPFESEAKDAVLTCADFCSFRESFKLVL